MIEAAEGEVSVGGPIDRVTVTLRVFGEDLEPAEVTNLLGVAPTDAVRRGQVVEGRMAPPPKEGRWLLEIKSREPPDSVIRELFSRLNDHPDAWRQLHENYRVDLFLGLFMEEWSRGFGLSADTVAAVSSRKLPVEFDIYAVGGGGDGRDGCPSTD